MWKFPSDVRGWLTAAEGAALRDLAEDRIVAEIGSYHGRSTICMAQVAKRVHSIDWHQGDEGAGFGWTFSIFFKNLRAWNLLDKVVVHVGRSEDVGPILMPNSCDLAFIDGAHDTAQVVLDIGVAKRIVKSDGIFAFHDCHEDRIQEAMAITMGGGWQPIYRKDSLAWGRYHWPSSTVHGRYHR